MRRRAVGPLGPARGGDWLRALELGGDRPVFLLPLLGESRSSPPLRFSFRCVDEPPPRTYASPTDFF